MMFRLLILFSLARNSETTLLLLMPCGTGESADRRKPGHLPVLSTTRLLFYR